MKKNFILYIAVIILGLMSFTERIFADGFIVIPRPPWMPRPPHWRPRPPMTSFPLEVKYHRVNVEIKEQSAVTYIDQEFYNPTGTRLEGYYIFPVPEGAVIKEFSMFINGKETEAELLDAEKARRVYEDIVRKSLDPALLEYQGRGIFKVRIFPIEPNSTKRIKISYNQILEKDDGTIEYVYPLNTEKFSAKPIKDVSINVDIKTDDNLKNIYCPSHNAEIVRKSDHHAVISYEEREVKPDADFKLYYNTDKSKIGLSALMYGQGSKGYYFLSISPSFDIAESELSEKDITFVLDVSGSMAGEKLEQAKKALLFCVENLNKGDHFQVIRFSTEAEALFDNLKKPEKQNLQKAREFINGLKAIGGTNIEEALDLAFTNGDGKRPHIIIFITDGKPTIGETNEDKLVKKIADANRHRARVFTFGIGYDINTHLLDKITLGTKSYRYYISPKEDIEIKISNFYKKVQSPVLTDLKLSFNNNIKTSNMYPKDIPDLFKDSSLIILGEYKGHGDTKVVLKGMINNKQQRYEYNITFPKKDIKNDFIPPLWAARHIGYLLDQIRLNGEDKELVEEIIETSRKYGIVTPYTSYLIIEDERRRFSNGSLELDDQTLGKIALSTEDFPKRSEKEYRDMKLKSGVGSVLPSREFQALNMARNIEETRQGKSRLNFMDKSGIQQNIGEQVKNVLGRAVYYTGKFWVDSYVQAKKRDKAIRIKFASKAYFDLIKRNKDAGQFIALGRNVRFVLNEILYEIYD